MIIKTKLKRIALFALCAALAAVMLASAVCAASVTKTDGVFVYDQADVIPAETENDLNTRAKALFALTGSELVTVTLKSFDGKDRNTVASDLFADLKLSAGKNNSVLVMLVIDDDDYYVLPGSELTDKLNASVLSEVFNTSLEPDFAAKKYADGAKKTFDDLLGRIEKIYSVDVSTYDPAKAPAETEAAETAEKSSGFSIGKFFKWFFIILLILAGIFAAVVAVAFFRRPRYVNKRRHYNTDRGSYVGMSDIERARRREAAMRNRAVQNGGQPRPRPQGQQGRPYPQGQRPQGQYPQGQYPQRQYPQGQPQRPYPQGQRPANGVPGQQMRRPNPNAQNHEHPTAYPERAPYVNKEDQNSGANRGL